ncbi:MAG: zinc ribbon domain-containing protein [Verrucomicrobiota bacterium]
MPTYIYETVEEPNTRFELKQSMHEEALTHHPETGAPVRRVISGGYGVLQKSGPPAPSKPKGHGCCGGSCGCGH